MSADGSNKDYVFHDIATEIEQHIQCWDSFSTGEHKNNLRRLQQVALDNIEDQTVLESAEFEIYEAQQGG